MISLASKAGLDMTPQTLITRLCAVAPALAERLDTQAYRVNIEDDNISVKRLLEDLFEQLVDLLTGEYGVEFLQLEELMESTYHQECVLRLAELIMPQRLSMHIQNDPQLGQYILDAIRDPVADDPTILLLVEYAAQSAFLKVDYQDVMDVLLDRVSSSGVFDAYVEHVIDTMDQISAVGDLNVDEVLPYVQHVKDLKKKLTEALYIVADAMPAQRELLEEQGVSSVAALGVYMTSAARINPYAWVFLRSQDEDVSQVDRAVMDRYTSELHMTQPFFVEYYLVRKQLDFLGFVQLLAYLSVTYVSKVDFLEATKRCVESLVQYTVELPDQQLMREVTLALSGGKV